MARKKGADKIRADTLKSLENSIKEKELTDEYYKNLVDQYMGFFDDLNVLNKAIMDMKSDGNMSIRSYTDATAEKRRISNEMRGILAFLGLKPPEPTKGGGGYAEL